MRAARITENARWPCRDLPVLPAGPLCEVCSVFHQLGEHSGNFVCRSQPLFHLLKERPAFGPLKALDGLCDPFNHLDVFVIDEPFFLTGRKSLNIYRLATRGPISFQPFLRFLPSDAAEVRQIASRLPREVNR